MLMRAIPVRRLVTTTVLLVGILVLGGCSFLSFSNGSGPGGAVLGQNNLSDVTLSNWPVQVDVTLNNRVSGWVETVGNNCGWFNVNCIASGMASATSDGFAIAAAQDCGFAGGQTICPFQDLYRAAITFAFGGLGPSKNCLGFRVNGSKQFVEPTDPGTFQGPSSGTWYTVWFLNGTGYNGDGAGICTA